MPKLAIIYQNIVPLIPTLKAGYFNPGNLFDEIHMFTFDSSLTMKQKQDCSHGFGRARVKIHPIGGFNFHNVYVKRISVLKRIQRVKPDVIRSFSPQVDGYLATYVGKKLGIPVVLSVHGERDRGNRHNMRLEKKYGQLAMSSLEKILFEIPSLERSSQIIAVYEFVAEYARKYTDTPVTVIYNKVDTTIFSPGQPKTTPFTIINVGRFMRGKNQEVLIRAMQHVDGRLLLIGQGDTLADMKRLTVELDVKGKVEFIPVVRNEELADYYRSAHIYATGNQYGGVAIPVLEAMACGLPIVQCPYPFKDKPEFIEDAGLVVDRTPEDFARGINLLEANPDLRLEMGEYARKKMIAHNTVKMDELEIQVYECVLKKY